MKNKWAFSSYQTAVARQVPSAGILQFMSRSVEKNSSVVSHVITHTQANIPSGSFDAPKTSAYA